MADAVTPDRSYAAVAGGLDMPLEEAMLTQRAVRRVLPDPVDDDIVLRCIELALKAPTGSNGQNWEFVVVKDRGVKARLARPLPAGLDGLRRHRPTAWRPGRRVDGARSCGPSSGRSSTSRSSRCSSWPACGARRVPLRADAADRRVLLLRLDLPERAEPAAGRPGHGPRRLAHHPAAVEHHRRPAASSACRCRSSPRCVVPLGWPRGRYGPTTRKPVGDVVHLDRFGNQPFKA